jgi:predicted porin
MIVIEMIDPTAAAAASASAAGSANAATCLGKDT